MESSAILATIFCQITGGMFFEELILKFYLFPAFLLVASCFLLFAFCFSHLAFCLLLLFSACCFRHVAPCCSLLSLSYSSGFLLLAVSFLLPVSCCLRSPECSLLSVLPSWFSLTALSFPMAAIGDCFLLLLACFFQLSTCRFSCVTNLHHFHIFHPLSAVAISFVIFNMFHDCSSISYFFDNSPSFLRLFHALHGFS